MSLQFQASEVNIGFGKLRLKWGKMPTFYTDSNTSKISLFLIKD